ncbi:hypothetical protein HDC30_004113 [Pseudomonas sp. JAI115]|uniref:hypothetical protein n=1 Tax=Pseudomonas sp. JAI115 TaxID=2723061 RepID=UPI00161F1D23|nr:hypothetical protein [Pseudomonas sp. JAI115]MBB6156870.1 hypothetical protein [Pseudomonas sp. JAI115]
MQLAVTLLCIGLLTISGCANNDRESFIFTADLPPDFAYHAKVMYKPADGETCSVRIEDKPFLGFNREWRTEYIPKSVIPIYRTVNGCRLAVNRIQLQIIGSYGGDTGDIGSDSAAVIISDKVNEQEKGVFEQGESLIEGECQWLFRTQGPLRRLSKGPRCNGIDTHGMLTKGKPFGAYTLDQLPGKTVRLRIKIAVDERPSIKNTWIEFHNGWKRCLGKGMDDQYGFCRENKKDFSDFLMPDGRTCSIYPGCTE